MNDTPTMSGDRQRVRALKAHFNRICSKLREMEPNILIEPLEISISSQLTTLSNYEAENDCPILSCKIPKTAVLHSTTNSQYRKKSKKILFTATALATSTPKSSPIQNKVFLKPYHTSTPRRHQRHSTVLDIQPNNNIQLKRLLYSKEYEKRHQNKRRHSAVPSSKRSGLPRLYPIEENAQWI